MGNTSYYKMLTKAAKRKNKSEWEVYKNISTCIDDILEQEPDVDEKSMLKALIAYFEGKSSHSWFTAIMSIAYALIIGAVCLLPSLKMGTKSLTVVEVALIVCTIIVVLCAHFNLDFENKIVVCVLNDKLEK